MASSEPLVLRLPPSMSTAFDLARLLAEDGRWSWAQGYELLERFGLAEYERDFAKALLRTLTRFWLYRTNQRRGCGDFVAVDMSPPDPRDRRAVVIELKLGERLAEGRGLNSPQLGSRSQALWRWVARWWWSGGIRRKSWHFWGGELGGRDPAPVEAALQGRLAPRRRRRAKTSAPMPGASAAALAVVHPRPPRS